MVSIIALHEIKFYAYPTSYLSPYLHVKLHKDKETIQIEKKLNKSFLS